MNRLENLRARIDTLIHAHPDREEKRCGFVHLYGVSAICVLLAQKRQLHPELAAAAGMLHDIWNYQVGPDPEHAAKGAPVAEEILRQQGDFSEAEIQWIIDAIRHHSDKDVKHSNLAELLKDADIYQHYLYNPSLEVRSTPRLHRVFLELGLDPTLLDR